MTRRVILGCCLSLVVGMAWGPSAARAGTLPYFTDTFDDKNLTDNDPVNWKSAGPTVTSLSADTGDLTFSTSGFPVVLALGTEAFNQGTIRAVIRMIETKPAPDYQYLGLVARSSASGSQFYYGGITTAGYVTTGVFGGVDSGGPQLPLDPRTMDVDLEFVFSGDRAMIWAWSDEKGIAKTKFPQASRLVARSDPGLVGLVYNSNGGSGTMIVRSFSVIVPEPHGALSVGLAAILPAVRRRQRRCG